MAEQSRRTVEGWPRWAWVEQKFPGEPVADLGAAVAEAVAELRLAEKIQPGQSVAISAGSRGIQDAVAVTRATVDAVRRLGAEPFIFPCMGSHGGATAPGQCEVLRGYGITEENVGAPVRSADDLVSVGTTNTGIPLWCDKLAVEADHILLINRVKPHTDFDGVIESGPTKMLAIGIGKHVGASDTHRRFVERGYEAVIREVGDALWDKLDVVGGIGIVENGHGHTVRIGAVRPERHEADEAALLAHAKEVFGYLPVDFLHVLVIDWMGKDISGSGIDPNVTGTDCCKTHRPPEKPFIWRVLVRGLTAASHGNAAGIGNADFCLQRCADAVDWGATTTNLVTAASPEGGRRPLVLPNDQALLTAAFKTTGSLPPAELRLIRIESTLHPDRFLASEVLLPELAEHPRCTLAGDPQPIGLDAAGFLSD